jgi:hypothetical protein
MSPPSPEQMRAYVAALARITADRPEDHAQQQRLATALAPLLALADRLGPWPMQEPAGPLDPGV